jgi:hypothetical protein
MLAGMTREGAGGGRRRGGGRLAMARGRGPRCGACARTSGRRSRLPTRHWTRYRSPGRSSQTRCSGPGSSPSGSSLPSASATRPKIRSVCRQVSRCGPCFQSASTPSRRWSSSPSAVSAWCTRVRRARPVISLGQAHPGQQGPDLQLPGAYPYGEHGLDPRRDAGGIDNLLERRQPQLVRAAGQPRRPQPAGVQAGQPSPGERRGGQQPGVVEGQHRHRARRARHRGSARRPRPGRPAWRRREAGGVYIA